MTAPQKSFRKQILTLSLPILLQNLINALVSYADMLMMAFVGQTALNAVSLAGQVTYVLTLLHMGLSTGVSIWTAQYWGARNRDAICDILGIALRLSAAVSAVFAALTWLCPEVLMRVFTPDAVLIAQGASYLRVLAVSYLCMAVSQMLMAALKSMEKVRVCAWTASGCLLLNIVLNALAVFVLFPNDAERAILGVAAATVLSRIAELVLCLIWAKKNALHYRAHAAGKLWKAYLGRTALVQANYLVWGGAMAACSALVGHISSDMVSAWSVAGSVRNLAVVACGGLAAGGSIMVGNALGRGALDEARELGDRLCRISLVVGAISGVLLLCAAPFCGRLFRLNAEADGMLRAALLFCTVWCVGKAFNSMTVGGIFCAGGDTLYGLLCDGIAMWGIVLPAACLCAFALHMSPTVVLGVLCADEIIKIPANLHHYRRYGWVKNLTK